MSIIIPLINIAIFVAVFVLAWALPRRFGGHGLIGYMFVLPIGILAMFCIDMIFGVRHQYNDMPHFAALLLGIFILYCLTLPLSLVALWQRATADRSISRLNPRVSIYWLWLVVIAGVLANVPVVPYDPGKAPAYHLPVTFLYKYAISDTRSWTDIGDDKWILGHAIVSVVLAVVATVLHRVWAKQHQTLYRPDPTNFTLRGLLLTTAVLAGIFGLLASAGSMYILYVVVLLFVAGRMATLLLLARGL